MSTEEDTELRDLVAQTLEINGCLPKIRAELRASIFLALDEDAEKQEPLLNKKIKKQLESQDGQIMFCLVREFLEYFDLDFTISVYEPESYLGPGYHYGGRSKIIEDLGISQLKENPTLPLLLQLIQIARLQNATQNKNLNINLSKIQNEGCTTEEEPTNSSTHNEDSNKIKTDEVGETKDSSSSTSISGNLNLLEVSHSNDNSINGVFNPITEIHTAAKEANLNETFDVSSPTSINVKESKKAVKQDDKLKPSLDIISNLRLPDSLKSASEEKDDTYDGTSSIAEDSVKDSPQLDLDKITQNSEKSQSLSETEFSPPILKDSKSHSKFDMSFDKLKLSPQKTEKLKAKSSLSSLADLPPLQLNKSRNDTVLLPSLYSKEFKEKTANQTLRELDKFFDVDVDSLDNYEEDFMSESEINLNSSRNNLLDELQSSSITDSNKNVSIKSAESKTSYSGKGLFLQNAQKLGSSNKETCADTNQNLEKSKTEVASPKNTNGVHSTVNSGTSSVASDEINLNIDDILNSPTSN